MKVLIRLKKGGDPPGVDEADDEDAAQKGRSVDAIASLVDDSIKSRRIWG